MVEYDDGGGAALATVHGDDRANPYPERWAVNQRVIWVRGDEYGYTRPGMKGVVVRLSDECRDKRGDEYQVFWCTPINEDGTRKSGTFWTTPAEVRPIESGEQSDG